LLWPPGLSQAHSSSLTIPLASPAYTTAPSRTSCLDVLIALLAGSRHRWTRDLLASTSKILLRSFRQIGQTGQFTPPFSVSSLTCSTLLILLQPAARVDILHAALCNASAWTEQEALEKWLKKSVNEFEAMSARNMRTVRPSAPLCPTSHHRLGVFKPLPKRYSTPLCRSIRCLRHLSHACTVYVQLMSSFKQLYAHQGLKQLSQDASVSAIVSSIIKQGRLHSRRVLQDAQPVLCAFVGVF